MSDEANVRDLVIVATYNELENLPLLITDIHERHPDLEVLVIDDNSPDGTGQWAQEFALAHPWCHVMVRSGKLGLGSATVAGFNWAIKHRYSSVITMDADFSHDPGDLQKLLDCRQATSDTAEPARSTSSGPSRVHRPIIIGSRYVAGGAIAGWPWTRRIASFAINRFARFWLGLPTRDNSGAFRCYPVSLLRELPLQEIRNQGYGYLEEILYLAKQHGGQFTEVPITFRDRTRGVSKINAREALNAVMTLWQLPFRSEARRTKSR